MGGLSSRLRRRELPQPTIRADAGPAEQQPGEGERRPEVAADDGKPALVRAVEAGDEAEVRRLLYEGVSTEEAYGFGRTPLMTAVTYGAAGLCVMLADAGADVNARNTFKQTALHFAAERRDGGAALVHLLLQRGASTGVQDIVGRTPLHCALQASNLATAEMLAPTVGPQLQRDMGDRTELHWAAAKGTPEIVRQILDRTTSGGGSDRDAAGMTPLAMALQALNRETAGVLAVEACPYEEARAPDSYGRTVLHWAAYAGYPEVVRQLMERDFSPWVRDDSGRDALHWAVDGGARQAVEEILKDDGFSDCADCRGRTALHAAAIRGDAEVAAMLLDRGADAYRVDWKGRIPLMYALRRGNRDAAMLLSTRVPISVRWADRKKRTLLHWAAEGGDVELVRHLLDHGAPINAVDAQCRTPAVLAVDHGHQEAAAVLIETEGFRVIHDREGRTPLHGAAAAGWTQVAMRLLELGAHPYDGGCDNLSPVELADRAGHHSLARDIERYRGSPE